MQPSVTPPRRSDVQFSDDSQQPWDETELLFSRPFGNEPQIVQLPTVTSYVVLPANFCPFASSVHGDKATLALKLWRPIVRAWQAEHGRSRITDEQKTALKGKLHEDLKRELRDENAPVPVFVRLVQQGEPTMEGDVLVARVGDSTYRLARECMPHDELRANILRNMNCEFSGSLDENMKRSVEEKVDAISMRVSP